MDVFPGKTPRRFISVNPWYLQHGPNKRQTIVSFGCFDLVLLFLWYPIFVGLCGTVICFCSR